MNWMRRYAWSLTAAALLSALALPAFAQTSLSAITGRADDTSGGALPGVTVSISSPQMIGGARTAVTDDQGVYRFTLLPGGTYTVKFEIPGFNVLNIEGVVVGAGQTMTINGKLQVATLQETVTVTSQAPTIDLESSKVAVNWDQQKLDEIPYSRSSTGLVALIPGLYATSLDVGGSSFGTGSGPAARTFGRAGGGVVSYDGMIWDQTYGDFGTYEEAQVTTAAKGADSMNPGLTMNLIVKSGSNTFKGSGNIGYQNGDMQSNNVSDELIEKGYAPGTNKFTSLKDFYAEVGGPIVKDRLWFYASHRDAALGQLHSRLHQPRGSAAGRVLHQAAGPDGQDDVSDDAEQQDRGDVPGGPEVAALSHRQPLRSARIDAEPGLDVAGGPVLQVAHRFSRRARRSTRACSAAATGGRIFRGRATCAGPIFRRATARHVVRSSKPIAIRAAGSTAAPSPTSPRCGARITS